MWQQRRTRPWLFRELRRRRSATWRRAWKLIAPVVLIFMPFVAVVVLLERRHPLAEGLLLGLILTAVAGSGVVLFWTAEGSLAARLWRLHESAVGDELKRAPGVYSVHRNVEFGGLDVDYVVVAPSGVFAFEVKAMTFVKPKPDLDSWTHERWAEQATLSARKVRLLLSSRGITIDVHPVVALIGSGVPRTLPAYEWEDGVRWVTVRGVKDWRSRLGLGNLDRETADRIRGAIESYIALFRPDADS